MTQNSLAMTKCPIMIKSAKVWGSYIKYVCENF